MSVEMGRMGPIYDREGLINTIKDLIDSNFERGFYGRRPVDVPLCQGDVLKMSSKFPFIDEFGKTVAVDHPAGLWQVLGNTCDLDRSPDDVPYTQLAPVIPLDPDADLEKLKYYTVSRAFYLPPIDSIDSDKHLLTDLTRPVTVHKKALLTETALAARLESKAWMLFHCVLVRFLARDDGRFD